MIIWLNGAFGAGKTTCATELAKQISNSHVFDPETIGEYIHNNCPRPLQKEDFQDYPLWRTFTYEMLCMLATEYEGHIIVPMTLTNVQYYNEIIRRLEENNITVKHFILTVEKDVLIERLSERKEAGTWAAQQIDRCLSAFEHHIQGMKIPSSALCVEHAVKLILSQIGS